MTGERARDGDYALNDLAALRARPFHAARDFEGFTHRDIVAPTVLVRHIGKAVDISTTTGIVWWKTDDRTDLDYTPIPLITRENAERDLQFTQEVRFASSKDAPDRALRRCDAEMADRRVRVHQNYEQDAVNRFSPFVLSPFVNFPVAQHSPQSTLEDRGIGVYGRGTFTIRETARRNGRHARRPRAQARDARYIFRPCHRAGHERDGSRTASPMSRRTSRWRITSRRRRRWSMPRPLAASRRAGSMPPRHRAAKPMARSTAGTTKRA